MRHVINKGKRKNIVIEGCPTISDITVKERSDLFDKLELCKPCGKRSTEESHSLKKCFRMFLSKSSLKCYNQECLLRYSLCDQHRRRNLTKHKVIKKRLKEKFNVDYKI